MHPPPSKKIAVKKQNVQLEPNASEVVPLDPDAPNKIKDPVPSIKVKDETIIDNGRVINTDIIDGKIINRNNKPISAEDKCVLETGLFVLGGLFLICAAIFLLRDRRKPKKKKQIELSNLKKNNIIRTSLISKKSPQPKDPINVRVFNSGGKRVTRLSTIKFSPNEGLIVVDESTMDEEERVKNEKENEACIEAITNKIFESVDFMNGEELQFALIENANIRHFDPTLVSDVFSYLEVEKDDLIDKKEFKKFVKKIKTQIQEESSRTSNSTKREVLHAMLCKRGMISDIAFFAAVCYYIGGLLNFLLGMHNILSRVLDFDKDTNPTIREWLQMFGGILFVMGGWIVMDLAVMDRTEKMEEKRDREIVFYREMLRAGAMLRLKEKV